LTADTTYFYRHSMYMIEPLFSMCKCFLTFLNMC